MADSQLMPTNGRFQDLTGIKFGRLTVLNFHGTVKRKTGKSTRSTWMCKCDCGHERVFMAQFLKSSKNPSCDKCIYNMNDRDSETHLRQYILDAIKVSESGCWEWQRSKSKAGPNAYGEIYSRGRKQPAHVFSYRLFRGEIPDDIFVCHACDNTRCCYPLHLFLGTHQDNMKDKCKKGRQSRGELHGRSKLTKRNIDAIRVMSANGISNVEIAATVNVSPASVGNVLNGRTWSWYISPAETSEPKRQSKGKEWE